MEEHYSNYYGESRRKCGLQSLSLLGSCFVPCPVNNLDCSRSSPICFKNTSDHHTAWPSPLQSENLAQHQTLTKRFPWLKCFKWRGIQCILVSFSNDCFLPAKYLHPANSLCFSTLSILGPFYKSPLLSEISCADSTGCLQGGIHLNELQQPGIQLCCPRWPSSRWRSVIFSLGERLRQVWYVSLTVKWDEYCPPLISAKVVFLKQFFAEL